VLGWMATSLLAVGCGSGAGGSACDKVVQGYKDYAAKASACGVTLQIGNFDQASCEAALSNCTAQDKDLYGDFGSCLSALPSCTAGNSTPFVNAVLACTDKLSGLSSNCQ